LHIINNKWRKEKRKIGPSHKSERAMRCPDKEKGIKDEIENSH
jgi:hypothetical protein